MLATFKMCMYVSSLNYMEVVVNNEIMQQLYEWFPVLVVFMC